MKPKIDRITLSVPDLDAAIADYGRLFGVHPAHLSTNGETARAALVLANTVLELQERPEERPRVAGLAFTGIAPEAVEASEPLRGLELIYSDGAETNLLRNDQGASHSPLSVDHVVLRTADAEDCVRLFRDSLGIRLALDQTVPDWGGRMLFFRTGGLTLEVIESQDKKPSRDYFWGIAYQCPDIDQTTSELKARGVSLSSVRAGRKPGTRVATPRDCVLDIPTLIIEPARSA